MRYETNKQHEFRQVLVLTCKQEREGHVAYVCMCVGGGRNGCDGIERDRKKEKSDSQIIPFYVSGWRSCVFKQAEITSGLSLF